MVLPRCRAANGAKPISEPSQLGCCGVAPLCPQTVQRAHRLSLLLDVSAPQRIMSGTNATGAWCKQRLQLSHSDALRRPSSASVGTPVASFKLIEIQLQRFVHITKTSFITPFNQGLRRKWKLGLVVVERLACSFVYTIDVAKVCEEYISSSENFISQKASQTPGARCCFHQTRSPECKRARRHLSP